jgi:photosystem II stability/assembly factor-like uncharacterized protein
MITKRPHFFRNAAAFLVLVLFLSNNVMSQTCTYTWGTQTSGATALLYSVKAVNGLVGWSAGATAVVRRTIDGGLTWTNANPNPGVIVGDIYNIEALDANTAWVTTSGASTFIYKTTNGGTNWTQVFSLAGGFMNAIKMVSATTGYAFGDPVASVWVILKTTDGGTTWLPLATAPASVAGEDGRNNCVQIMGNDIWFGTGQNKVYHSTNMGVSWTNAVVTGITGQITGLQFNTNLVGIVGGATMSKTTDGGATWTLLAASGTGTISGIKGKDNNFWYVRGTGIFRSTDLGASWTSVHTQTAAQNDISLVTDGSCLSGWSAGTTGTTSKMSGQAIECSYTWSTQTSGVTNLIYSVKTVNGNIGWAAGAAATVRRTTDGGSTWTNANPNPGVIVGDIYNIEALDANTAWVTTSGASTFIYKTTNGGTNWTQVFALAGGFMNAIKMVSPTHGYAFGDPVASVWVILATTDGGTTWTQMPSAPASVAGEDGRNNCVQILANDIWFGTGQNKVYHSTNLGLNWSNAVVTGITGQITGIQFNSSLVGIVGGATMSKTTDGGATWTLLAASGTGTISGIEGTGTNYWYVRGTGIFRSTDLGATWTSVHTQTAAQNDISLVSDGAGCMTGWSGGTTGTISKMAGTPTGINDPSSEIPSVFRLEQNYPNPFNPTTSITYAMPLAGNVEIKVYDIVGKEVATLVNSFMTAGTHNIAFDASSLASGIYIYKLTSGSFTDSKKMVLIK